MAHSARKPKYTLVIKSRANEKRMTIAGVVFANEFGGLNIILNPGVVLKWDDDVYFNLNPYLTKRQWVKLKSERSLEYDVELEGDPPGGDEVEEEEEPEPEGLDALLPDDDEPK